MKTINENFKLLSEHDKIIAINYQAKLVLKLFNQMEKSNANFVNSNTLNRTGIRGGKATSIIAKNEIKNDFYHKSVELLQFMTRNI